jgi:LPXTG-site transpeptidase (sortase) family protein
MLTPKLVLKLLPSYLLMAVIFSWPLVWPAHLRHVAAQANTARLYSVDVKIEPAVSGARPIELAIPRLGVKLAIKEGGFDRANGWALDWQHAFYAQETELVGNQGSHTLIYGHDTAEVFKPTKQLAKGDQLIITTKDNQRLEYYFEASVNVPPTDVSILSKQSSQPEVTLLTCDGTFEQERRLMTFKYLRLIND